MPPNMIPSWGTCTDMLSSFICSSAIGKCSSLILVIGEVKKAGASVHFSA